MGCGRSRGSRPTSRPWTSDSASPAPSATTGTPSAAPGRLPTTAPAGSTTSPSPTAGPADMNAAQAVRDIVEASRYLVLATADATGRPWSSPVYFAHIGFTEYYWVSSLEDGEIARGIEAFSRRSVAHGARVWMSQDVRPDAGMRLYRATAG